MIKKPKDMFEIYEQIHFFYRDQNKPDIDTKIEKIKSDIGSELETKLRGIIQHIGILLEGDITHQNYTNAFKRYLMYYKDFSPQDLRDFYRFICTKFNIILPTNSYTNKKIKKYVPSSGISSLLNDNPF